MILAKPLISNLPFSPLLRRSEYSRSRELARFGGLCRFWPSARVSAGGEHHGLHHQHLGGPRRAGPDILGLGSAWRARVGSSSLARYTGSLSVVLAVLALVAYYVMVNTGVWRAATLYQGPAIWAGLAKAASGLGLLCIAALGILLTLALGAGPRQSTLVAPTAAVASPATRFSGPDQGKQVQLKPFEGKLGGEQPEPESSAAGFQFDPSTARRVEDPK